MPPGSVLLAGAIVLVVVQRLGELRLARRNEAWAREQGAVEHGRAHYRAFFVLHAGWLIAWATEAAWRGPTLADPWWPWVAVFALAQGLRYWAILTLGPRWNTRILVLPGLAPIRRGPYRWLRHPNYLAVVLELGAAPMLFGAWITAVGVGLANAALLLAVRIPAEQRALARWGTDGETAVDASKTRLLDRRCAAVRVHEPDPDADARALGPRARP